MTSHPTQMQGDGPAIVVAMSFLCLPNRTEWLLIALERCCYAKA